MHLDVSSVGMQNAVNVTGMMEQLNTWLGRTCRTQLAAAVFIL